MNFIWETVNKYVPENMADGVFLTTLIVGWCVLVFGVGMLFCVVAAGSASACRSSQNDDSVPQVDEADEDLTLPAYEEE